MSTLKDLVIGGPDCSGSNNPLAKLIPQISGTPTFHENQYLNNEMSSQEHQFNPEFSNQNPQLNHMLNLERQLSNISLSHHKEHLHHSSMHHNSDFTQEFLRDQFNEPGPSNQYLESAFQSSSKSNISQQNSDWNQEFTNFKGPIERMRPMHSNVPRLMPHYTQPFHHMVTPQDFRFEQPKEKIHDVTHWDAEFDKAQNISELEKQHNMDDMARTAGELLANVDTSIPKFRDSSFMQLMQNIKDGKLKVEGNEFVATDNISSSKQDLRAETQKSLLLDENTKPEDLSHEDVAKNWTEEFIERQEVLFDNAKATITDLSDGEFDEAFKFTNWVEEYKDSIRSMNNDGQEIDWNGLERDWQDYSATGRTQQSTSLLYEKYQFSGTNPFLSAPLSIIDTATNSSDLSEALLALEAKVQQTPEDASAWHKLGIRQQENEREASAIAALRQAVKLDPSLCDAWLALSVSYTNENCIADAYDSLESWMQHNPRYTGIIEAYRGQLVINEKRHDSVFSMFLDAVRSNNTEQLDPEVQIALGVLLNISEEYDKAVDCFQAALATRPDDYLLWNKLGATLANSQEPSRAIEAYFRALELNPSFIRARYNLAISSINLGQYLEATEHLLAALALQVQEHETNLPPEMGGGSMLLPHEISGSSSSHVWDTLRMTLYLLDRADLVESCDAKDLDAFRREFNF